LSESQSKASVQGTGAFTFMKISDLLNSYNFIASSYSFWSRLMYGNSLQIENHQKHPLTWFMSDFHLEPKVKYRFLCTKQVK